jgi:uncharacterized protein
MKQGRVLAPDVLRGVALFGIFQMNVQLFAFPLVGYMRPTLVAPLEGLDLVGWLFTHLVCEFKFISVFAMLFGAGVVFADAPPRTFWSRQFWLLMLGLAHAYLVWFGDILVTYAVAGSLTFALRTWPVRKQLIAAAVLFFLPVLLIPLFEGGLSVLPRQLQQLAHEGFSPSVEALARETAINRGPWLAQLRFRAGQTSESELFALLLHVWRAAGCMVLGMALARSGVLAGEHPEVERKLVRFGLLLGVPLSVTSAVVLLLNDFPESAALTMGLVSYVASLPLALALLGGVLMALRRWPARFGALAAAGRMALTHYLSQSLLAGWLFYGFGLGLFGALARWQLVPLAASVWLVQVAASPWLERTLGRGPFERVWRRLTKLTAP